MFHASSSVQVCLPSVRDIRTGTYRAVYKKLSVHGAVIYAACTCTGHSVTFSPRPCNHREGLAQVLVVLCNGDVHGVHHENLPDCIRIYSHLIVTHLDCDARGEW